MTGTKDTVQPGAKWEFDAQVAEAFDDMLARSIPQYQVMRNACFELGSKFVAQHTDVVDLGCSRGEALAPFIKRFGATVRYVGIEVSEPMRTACQQRFAGYIDTGLVSIRGDDLREKYPAVCSSLTLCVLTLQFTPIEHRLRIMRDIWKSLRDGGALILVEKIIGATADLDTAFIESYYEMKRRNGYTEDDIQRKRLSLEGVLVPVTAQWNEDLLKRSGFSQVDAFWRWMNFCGWIAVK